MGLAGTTGQNAVTATSTSGVTLTASALGPLPIPGLTATVDTTSTSVLYIETDGGITNNGSQVNDFVAVDIRVLLDGVQVAVRTYEVELGKFSARNYWSYAVSVATTPGSHTVTVDTSLRSASAQNGLRPTATVGAGPNNPTHGTLNVVVLNR
jgi:hypothetical protein